MSSDLDADLAAATALVISERQVELAAPRVLEIPRVLPVGRLSHSSIGLLKRCPIKWKRRYIDGEYEPASGAMVAGNATGGSERRNFEQKIDSDTDLELSDLLDVYADEWHAAVEKGGEVDWKDDKPDKVRSTARAALEQYHTTLAPKVHPTSTERRFELGFDGADWVFMGYLDLEESDGTVSDLKCKGRRLSQADADSDLQVAAYMLARRAEQNPAAGFRFHTMIRTAKPVAEIIPTTRSDAQLDSFLERIMFAAKEIAWRTETDCWDAAQPGTWWCSQKWCGHWDDCAFGGLR